GSPQTPRHRKRHRRHRRTPIYRRYRNPAGLALQSEPVPKSIDAQTEPERREWSLTRAHSYRKAASGSIRHARRSGIKAATITTPVSTATAAARIAGLKNRTPYSML